MQRVISIITTKLDIASNRILIQTCGVNIKPKRRKYGNFK